MPKHSQRYWLAAFVVAFLVDFLFWGKPIGISFPIFIIAALAAGYALLQTEKLRASWATHLLVGMVGALALMTVLRSEEFTRFLGGFFALGGLGLLVLTFRSGRWVHFRILDFIAAPFELMVVGMTRGAGLALLPAGQNGEGREKLLKKALPLLRGLLIALPLVIFLTAMLASADLVFADQVEGLLDVFNIANLPEYLFRLFYIVVLAYVFAGFYLQSIFPTRWGMRVKNAVMATTMADGTQVEAGGEEAGQGAAGDERVETTPGLIRPFLGATEAFVVLGSVDLLFAFFVAVQFRYFFGGQANITAAGYTYSEYARKGFFELVVVAVVSLLLYLSLNAVTRRETATQSKVFTGLAVLLVGLVWVILASAFQRLLLYEAAYGFTNLRVYTHIFIPWLGLLLLAVIVMQIVRREQYFGALLLFTAFGFALTFGAINIDGLIVRQNVARARAGSELDGQYLVELSDDALPALVSEFDDPAQPEQVRDLLGAVLYCRNLRAGSEDQERSAWQSYHPGREAAQWALAGVDINAYQVTQEGSGPVVRFGSQLLNCYQTSGMD